MAPVFFGLVLDLKPTETTRPYLGSDNGDFVPSTYHANLRVYPPNAAKFQENKAESLSRRKDQKKHFF